MCLPLFNGDEERERNEGEGLRGIRFPKFTRPQCSFGGGAIKVVRSCFLRMLKGTAMRKTTRWIMVSSLYSIEANKQREAA